eukprot:SM000088S23738  [mRNA]  locus=s88:384341:385043:- [translate_table: standard]
MLANGAAVRAAAGLSKAAADVTNLRTQNHAALLFSPPQQSWRAIATLRQPVLFQLLLVPLNCLHAAKQFSASKLIKMAHQCDGALDGGGR